MNTCWKSEKEIKELQAGVSLDCKGTKLSFPKPCDIFSSLVWMPKFSWCCHKHHQPSCWPMATSRLVRDWWNCLSIPWIVSIIWRWVGCTKRNGKLITADIASVAKRWGFFFDENPKRQLRFAIHPSLSTSEFTLSADARQTKFSQRPSYLLSLYTRCSFYYHKNKKMPHSQLKTTDDWKFIYNMLYFVMSGSPLLWSNRTLWCEKRTVL